MAKTAVKNGFTTVFDHLRQNTINTSTACSRRSSSDATGAIRQDALAALAAQPIDFFAQLFELQIGLPIGQGRYASESSMASQIRWVFASRGHVAQPSCMFLQPNLLHPVRHSTQVLHQLSACFNLMDIICFPTVLHLCLLRACIIWNQEVYQQKGY